MNKAELVEEVADQTGITRKMARNVVDIVTETIKDTLSNGERVTFLGFGTFRVSQRKERKGRNPQTGEGVQIPAKKVPKFKAGKNLREAVR